MLGMLYLRISRGLNAKHPTTGGGTCEAMNNLIDSLPLGKMSQRISIYLYRPTEA